MLRQVHGGGEAAPHRSQTRRREPGPLSCPRTQRNATHKRARPVSQTKKRPRSAAWRAQANTGRTRQTFPPRQKAPTHEHGRRSPPASRKEKKKKKKKKTMCGRLGALAQSRPNPRWQHMHTTRDLMRAMHTPRWLPRTGSALRASAIRALCPQAILGPAAPPAPAVPRHIRTHVTHARKT
jgi:hypothetical protein